MSWEYDNIDEWSSEWRHYIRWSLVCNTGYRFQTAAWSTACRCEGWTDRDLAGSCRCLTIGACQSAWVGMSSWGRHVMCGESSVENVVTIWRRSAPATDCLFSETFDCGVHVWGCVASRLIDAFGGIRKAQTIWRMIWRDALETRRIRLSEFCQCLQLWIDGRRLKHAPRVWTVWSLCHGNILSRYLVRDRLSSLDSVADSFRHNDSRFRISTITPLLPQSPSHSPTQ
jgi:hypothetical protein